jgi:hypothetical protein
VSQTTLFWIMDLWIRMDVFGDFLLNLFCHVFY